MYECHCHNRPTCELTSDGGRGLGELTDVHVKKIKKNGNCTAT